MSAESLYKSPGKKGRPEKGHQGDGMSTELAPLVRRQDLRSLSDAVVKHMILESSTKARKTRFCQSEPPPRPSSLRRAAAVFSQASETYCWLRKGFLWVTLKEGWHVVRRCSSPSHVIVRLRTMVISPSRDFLSAALFFRGHVCSRIRVGYLSIRSPELKKSRSSARGERSSSAGGDEPLPRR